ncbi:MAG: right-handed parallel beta-helix repeat-containing protein [Candidatus Eisenbacteria bacterium]
MMMRGKGGGTMRDGGSIRRALFAGSLLGLVAASTSAQTTVTGNVTQNTTWTVGGSPYIIQKMIVEVKFGSTLTIDPGVEVRFQAGTSIQAASGGNSIVAVGSMGDSVRFTSNAGSPAMGDWYGVALTASPGSEFRRCVIEYAQYGLYLIDSDSPVERCRFLRCGYGVHAAGSECAIERSVFGRCDIGVWANAASPYVGECWITDSGIRGIWSTGNASAPTIYHCNMERNGINLRLDSYTLPRTVVATFNWWGSSSYDHIHPTIVDSADGHGQGLVTFEPWLNQVPVEASSWGRIKALFR